MLRYYVIAPCVAIFAVAPIVLMNSQASTKVDRPSEQLKAQNAELLQENLYLGQAVLAQSERIRSDRTKILRLETKLLRQDATVRAAVKSEVERERFQSALRASETEMRLAQLNASVLELTALTEQAAVQTRRQMAFAIAKSKSHRRALRTIAALQADQAASPGNSIVLTHASEFLPTSTVADLTAYAKPRGSMKRRAVPALKPIPPSWELLAPFWIEP